MHFNLLDLTEPPIDYSSFKVMLPLSGGINSAAALVFMAENHPDALKPAELHLYYSHFREHSPDTFKFVADCVRYARRKFVAVRFCMTRNSVNDFFLREKMIPHPMLSPCSRVLKIEPHERYADVHGIDAVLIGFVRSEMRRMKRAEARADKRATLYPIIDLTDENCFTLVKRYIGWYPAIYDIKEKGKRVFAHNNCLPCKNMTARQLRDVGTYFPEYARRAQETADAIPGAYWGRDDVPDVFKCDVCERF